MELVGEQVEQIRNRANYTKCMGELIQVRDTLINLRNKAGGQGIFEGYFDKSSPAFPHTNLNDNYGEKWDFWAEAVEWVDSESFWAGGHDQIFFHNDLEDSIWNLWYNGKFN